MKTSVISLCGGLVGVLLGSLAHAQNIGVNGSGCQVFAGDCATIVSLTQNRSVNIVVTNSDAIAQCKAVLPGGSFLRRGRRNVRCDFANTGQICEIGPVSASVSLEAGNADAIASAGADQNGVLSDASPIAAKRWKEIIRPDGQVFISCRGNAPATSSSSSQNVTVVQQQNVN